jgi:hypothetical protein
MCVTVIMNIYLPIVLFSLVVLYHEVWSTVCYTVVTQVMLSLQLTSQYRTVLLYAGVQV